MSSPPTGTVTFLFTDIEGSISLWKQHPDVMRVVLARQNASLRGAIEKNGGYDFKTVGDAHCGGFYIAAVALTAALDSHLDADAGRHSRVGKLPG